MTPDELTAAIDAMAAAAGDNPDLLPGLIEANSTDWCETLYQIERTAKTLDEGIRQRAVSRSDIQDLKSRRPRRLGDDGGAQSPPRDYADSEAASPACLQGFNNAAPVRFQMQESPPRRTGAGLNAERQGRQLAAGTSGTAF